MTSSFRPALATLLLISLARALAAQDVPETARAPRDVRVELRAAPQVDLRAAPQVVEETRPRFSWVIDDPRRGAAQSAYQLLVASSVATLRQETGDLWDSTKVLSPGSIGVEYAGKPLTPGRTVHWAVRTWDATAKASPWSEPASFVVAPPPNSEWTAKWIRAGREPDASSIGHKSEIANAEDAWPWIQLDFGGDVRCDRARLHPAHPDGDASKPGALFPLQIKVYTDATGKFAEKAIRIAEYTWQDVPNAGVEPLELKFSPYTLRWLRIVATKIPKDGDRGFAMALGEIEVLDGAQNIAQRGLLTVSGSSGEPGYTPLALVDGALVPAKDVEKRRESLPRLRGSFTLDQPVTRALLHATALGAYELTVNGRSAGDARLAPGWTDYQKRVAYQTYDIAALLPRGDNAIGVQLAPGWYAGRIGLAAQLGAGRVRALYGEEPAFFAEGEIVLDNGKRVTIRTDENWRWNRAGPLLAADLLDGESRDARLESPGWDAPQFQGTGWRPVEVATDLKPALFAQRDPPVRAWDVRPALSVKASGPDAFVYDFGQNLSGVVRIRIAGAAGTTVTVRHAEALGADGELDVQSLRTAAQTDVHVLRGGVETLEPRFTVHGFRYAEVSGLPAALDLSAIEAVVVGNDLREAGTFQCSDDALNRLWNAATWSLRSNLVGVPTGSPQNDERVAWLGDVAVVAPFALHRLDCAAFLSAWLASVRGAQASDGRFPDFAPDPFDRKQRAFGTPGQGDAGVLVPWEIFLRTHDLKLLRSSTASALGWVKHAAAKNPDGLWTNERGADFGDDRGAFPPAGGGAIAKDLFATAFLAHSARTAAKMAFATGDLPSHGAAREIAERATAAFRTAYVDGGKIRGDAQAAYALALDFGLYASTAEAETFADRLAARIREDGRLTCGFQTAHRALLALSRHGHHALALDLARRTTAPSWGSDIASGATTLGERAGSGASQNQLAAAAVGEWMVRAIAGLELADEHADAGAVTILSDPSGGSRTTADGGTPWSRIRFAPHVTGGLTHARAAHDGLAGRIESGWKLEGDVLTYACTVPPGSTATLDLPAKDVAAVTLDGKPVAESKELRPREGAIGTVRVDLVAGRWEFRSSLR